MKKKLFFALAVLSSTLAWSAENDIITFADSKVKSICVTNWDTAGDGELSEGEAAAVKSLNGKFKNNMVITSFDELRYFTSLKTLENNAFIQCEKLESIVFPDGITTIGNYAFNNCHNLVSVILPKSLTSLGECAFSQCRKLVSVTLHEGITSLIGVFGSCPLLESVNIPESVTSLNATFYDCKSLKSVYIPKNVTKIQNNALSGCSGLESIKVDAANTTYDSRNGCNAIIKTSTNELLYGCQNTEFPSGIVSIADNALNGMCNLNTAIIPEGVTSIGKLAFYKVTGLSEISLPSTLATIGEKAFEGCSNITKITSRIAEPFTTNVFNSSVKNNAILIVPSGTRAVYQGTDGWSDFKFIYEEGETVWTRNHTDPQGVEYTLNTTIEGKYYSVTGYTSEILSDVVIPDNINGCPVTTIASKAFNYCLNLTTITIPASINSMGTTVFTRSALTKIVSLIKEPFYVADFGSDINLNVTLIVPKGTKTAYQNTEGWNSIVAIFEEGEPIVEKEFTDEQGVIYSRQQDSTDKSYYYHVIGHTDELADEIILPASISNAPVKVIYMYAFGGCTSLTKVTLPNSLTTITCNAFNGCSALTDITSLIADPSQVKLNGAFSQEISENAVLQVPAGTRSAYKNAGWNLILYEEGEDRPQIMFTDQQGLKYELAQASDKTYYRIVGYTEDIAKRVTIPTQLFGYEVAYISNSAFANCTAMKWLYIPESVSCTSKSTTFSDCNFTLSLNQKNISDWSSSTYIEALELGDDVETIERNAFSDCTNLKKVNIPAKVTMNDYGSNSSSVNSPFKGCSALQEVTLECSRFGTWFRQIGSLKTVHLGKSVKEVSTYALSGCTGVKTITVDADNEELDSRDGCNAIINTATNKLLQGCSSTTIPQSVTAIGDYAFQGQTGLTEVTISSATTSIGKYAFEGCTGLQLVTSYIIQPFNINYAFDSSTQATAILRVPYMKSNYYKNVGGWNFTNIVEMDGTPEQMAVIEFADAEAKRLCVEKYDRNGDGEISMGEAQMVTTLGQFSNTIELISFDELKYFTNVTTLQSNAFSGCKNLTKITLPEGLTTIENSVFFNCTSLTSIVIPTGVTKISEQMFNGCTKLKEIRLHNGLTEIGNSAFRYCSSLSSIDIPEGVTTIGSYALEQSGLTSMNIPSTTTSIGAYALAGNIIYCNLTVPISVGTLMHNMSETLLRVPKGCEKAFMSADGWKDFIIIGADSENTDWAQGQVTITVDEPGELRLAIVESDEEAISRLKIKGKLNYEDLQYIVEGKGKLADLESLDLSEVTFQYGGEAYATRSVSHDDVWPIQTDVTKYYLAETEQVYLPGTHTPGIGNYTLTTSVYGPNLAGMFLNKAYKHIVMPAILRKAAADVFNGCSQLQSIEFPNGITEVDERAFLNCYSITSVDLQGVDSIHADAFNGCKMLQDVPHISGVKYLGNQAFKGCTRLTGDNGVLSLPQVDSIPEYTFYKCIMLSDVRLSESTKHIGEYAFSGCKTLPRITLPASLTVLPPNVFTDCAMLEDVNYTESLLQVDYTSFSNTPWIKSLSVEDGIKYMGHIAMAYDTTSGVADASPATLTFREGTTSIADGFGATMDIYPQYYGKNVTAISFPSTLKRIGDNAFKSRVSSNGDAPFSVKTLSLPDALEEIGEHAFAYAPSLTKLTLPENLKKIGYEAFYKSEKLTTVVYNTVEAVAQNLFSDCTSLELITIGPKVQLLPDGIFSGCTNLAIVKSAERTAHTPLNIGNAAFMNCEKLQRLTLPANMVEIGNQAFMGCTALKTFTASESLETIGSDAFNGCTALNSLTLNMGLRTIGDNAFLGCTAIPSFLLPESLDSIGTGAFSGCYLLKELTIPASITKLGNNFVGDCYNLTKLVVNMKQPASLYSIIDMSNGVVQEVYGYYGNWDAYREIHYSDVTLYVPDGTKSLYREAEGWKKFDNIQEMSGNDVTAKNKLNVSGTNVNSGMTSMVDVGLKNDIADFTAYQFDLVLPLGFTIATDAEGRLIAEKGTRYADAAQSLQVEQLAVHLYADFVKYRFLCMSPNTNVITGTDGNLLSFPLHVSDKVEDGIYKARIENAVFTQKDGTKHLLDKLPFNINVGKIVATPGDANGDGVVDVADVVAIVNYILNKPGENFNEQAADVNGDGVIDVADVVAVVNIILKGGNANSPEAKAHARAYLKAHGFIVNE